MEDTMIPGTAMVSSRVALGTWAIGGWMWGGSDPADAIKTIRTALDLGITLIDTAPAYGFGRSEELVGRAIAEHGGRERASGRGQPVSMRVGGGLGSVSASGLAQDAADVVGGCVLADRQCGPDLPVAEALGYLNQDLHLARR